MGLVAATLFGMTACTAAPPRDAWVLDPISYDNQMDGEVGLPKFIDVAYPMVLMSDTAGGFWGAASISWLHVDATGKAVRRFNLGVDAPRGPGVALSPTELIVTGGEGSSHDPRSIFLFDTEAMTWKELHRDERMLGAFAATGDDVYFVAYAFDSPTFTIERLALAPGALPVTVTPRLEGWGRVGLAVAQDGTLYVATTTEHIVLAGDGSVRSRKAIRSAYPSVDVNDRGDVAWSMGFAGKREVDTYVAGGSADARRIIDRHVTCEVPGPMAPAGVQDSLVVDAQQAGGVPLLCWPDSFTWLNDRELVVSIGSEGGAPLVRVTVPAP